MAHKIYDNFYLSNEIEDQYNSHLDLQQFCTVDNSLVGQAGMIRKINVYKATDGTEKLEMTKGNTKSIEVTYTPEEYKILLAQNRFEYYDEQAMTDPMLVPVGVRHMGTDMFNTVNKDIYLVGVDALDAAKNEVANGNMTGTVLNDAKGQATQAVECMEELLGGKTYAAGEQSVYVDYVKVTPDNVKDFQ